MNHFKIKRSNPVWFKLHFIISNNYTQTVLKTAAYSKATGAYLCSAGLWLI